MTFINDLNFGQVSEELILKELSKRYNPKQIKGSSCDIEFQVRIEVKRERAAKKYGNVAIELSYKETPSGPFASKADIWVWDIDGTFWWAYREDLLEWLSSEEVLGKYEVKMGGDGDNSELAIIPMLIFCNEIATRFKI